jgi:DNA-directed RNA polymerase subunit M/transcription elongation factor TFIIS
MDALLLKKYPGKDGERILETLKLKYMEDASIYKKMVLRALTMNTFLEEEMVESSTQATVSECGKKRKRESAEVVETLDDIEIKTRLVNCDKGQFQCSNCKSWKTSWEKRQMGSGDEPETLFIRCMNCKDMWKIGK